MREILFRGKCVDTNEWTYGSLIVYPDGDTYIASYTNSDDILEKYQVIPETVGQFAWVLDKNYERIFEDDIIKVKFGEDHTLIGIVEFGGHLIEGRWCIGLYINVIIPEFRDITFDYHNFRLFEVIGNCVDNPELLKNFQDSCCQDKKATN